MRLIKPFFSFVLFVLIIVVVVYALIELLPSKYFQIDVPTKTADRQDRSVYTFDTWSNHVECMDRFKTPDGFEMRYLDRGPIDGEVVLLLHWTPTSSWVYRQLINPLIDAGYRVVVPDMVGYWASEKVTETDMLVLQKQLDRLTALMSDLDIEVWHHGTHDMAGIRTRMLADQTPEHLASIIFFNTIAVEEWFHPPTDHGRISASCLGTLNKNQYWNY